MVFIAERGRSGEGAGINHNDAAGVDEEGRALAIDVNKHSDKLDGFGIDHWHKP